MRILPLADAALPAGIELFRFELDLAAEPTALRAALSSDEDARLQRFVQRADRVRFAAARSALRGLLAERVGRDPLSLRFEAGPQGKPFVHGAPRFNVAHSGTQALIALADPAVGLEVGVDIEHRSEDIDIEALGELVFTPTERAALRVADDRLAAFYLRWTGKEAVLKAIGVGITEHLQSLDIAAGTGAAIDIVMRVPAWQAVRAIRLDAPAGYAAALAWHPVS